MAYIKTHPGQCRLVIDTAEPHKDKCAFKDHLGPTIETNYALGRRVLGYGFDGQLSFAGHMCFDCMKHFGLLL